MKESQKRRVDAYGVGSTYWSHSHPETDKGKLWPALVGSGIELTKLDQPLSSWMMVDELIKRGDTVTDVPFNFYSPGTYDGVNRRLDNTDWLKGKEPLYGDDLHLADEIRQAVAHVRDEMISYYDGKDDPLSKAEMEDLPKITSQQWKPAGWFCSSPISDAICPPLGGWHLEWIDKIAGRYGDVLKGGPHGKEDIYSLIMQDDDPPDTMTGAPTFVSGERSHEARIAILRAIPSPDTNPREWVARIESLGMSLGFPERTFFSPVLSTRQGPMRKPVILWTRTSSGYEAKYSSVGAYSRTRYVFPAPYYVNFLLSPLYVQMSYVRKHVLGLWHDPDNQLAYVAQLRKQGKVPYTIDFTGMDTGMPKRIPLAFVRALRQHGFNAWSTTMFETLYPRMGITFPHFGAQRGMASLITGDATPWCSGFKLTSEMDTIYGMTVLLSCLSLQRPTIFDEWCSGAWIFLELGDDIMFTADFTIDEDKLSQDALKLWGAKLKIIPRDAMFLKWVMPVTPEVPHMTRTFARFLQQTFYNEDRYSGVEGGTRPDAIMRLALQARLVGLKHHPHFYKWWPKIYPILIRLGYVSRASAAYREALKRADPVLDAGDDVAIQTYAVKQPSYFLNLRSRANYEPSAALALSLVKEQGFDMNMDAQAAQMRKLYVDALRHTPTGDDIRTLASLCKHVLNNESLSVGDDDLADGDEGEDDI